jgi:hypothetical protein
MHTANKFILDFKQNVPKLDQVDDTVQETLLIRHNTVIMDPQTAKLLLSVMSENIQKYEKKYSKIEVPKKRPVVEKADFLKDFSYIA